MNPFLSGGGMKRVYCIWILILLAIGGCSKQKTVVARIENVEITLEDFQKDFIQNRTMEEILQADFSDKVEHLDAMMTDEILLQAARELSMEEDPYVQFRIGPLKRYYLIRRLYEKEIVNRYITSRDIRDFYRKMQFDVVVDRLSFEIHGRKSPDRKESFLDYVSNVRQRIKQGEPFEAFGTDMPHESISVTYVQDTLSYSASQNVIMETAYELKKNSVSEPIETSRGFHIIRVVDRISRPVKPLKETRGFIRDQLENKYNAFLSSKYDEMTMSFLDRVELKWQDDVILEMCRRFEPYPNLLAVLLPRLMKTWPEEFLQQALVRYEGTQFTVDDFSLRVQTLDGPKRFMIHRPDQLKRLLKSWIADDLAAQAALKRGLDRDSWVVSQLKDSLELAMKHTLLERDIIGVIDTSEVRLREFYELKKDEWYTFHEEATIQEVLLEDSASAVKVLRLAEKGKDFTELVMQYSQREAFKKIKGVIQNMRESDWGPIGKAAFALQEGQIGGPVAHDEGYSVIRLLEKKPPRTALYEWVDSVVKKDYIDSVRKKRFEAWLHDWEKTHRVERYEKHLLADEESG